MQHIITKSNALRFTYSSSVMNKPEPISPLFLEPLFDWNIGSRDIFTYNWIKNTKKQLSVK